MLAEEEGGDSAGCCGYRWIFLFEEIIVVAQELVLEVLVLYFRRHGAFVLIDPKSCTSDSQNPKLKGRSRMSCRWEGELVGLDGAAACPA
jgi:hypothetical protein